MFVTAWILSRGFSSLPGNWINKPEIDNRSPIMLLKRLLEQFEWSRSSDSNWRPHPCHGRAINVKTQYSLSIQTIHRSISTIKPTNETTVNSIDWYTKGQYSNDDSLQCPLFLLVRKHCGWICFVWLKKACLIESCCHRRNLSGNRRCIMSTVARQLWPTETVPTVERMCVRMEKSDAAKHRYRQNL